MKIQLFRSDLYNFLSCFFLFCFYDYFYFTRSICFIWPVVVVVNEVNVASSVAQLNMHATCRWAPNCIFQLARKSHQKKKEAFWSILRAENCCEFFHKQLTWPRRMQLGKTRARHSRNSFMARSLKLIGLPEGGWQETGREGGRQRYVLHMKLRISANRWLPENVAAKVTTGDGKWHISVHAHTHTHTHTCDSFS